MLVVERIEEFALKAFTRQHRKIGLKLRCHPFAQGLQIVLADRLGEVVVDRRRRGRADFFHVDFEHHLRASEFFGMVGVGKRQIDLAVLAPLSAPTNCSSKPGMNCPEPRTSW